MATQEETLPTPRASTPSSPINKNVPIIVESRSIEDDTELIDESGQKNFNTVIPKIVSGENIDRFTYKNSIATVCLPGTIKDKLLAISRSGFDGVEIMMTDLDEIDPLELKDYLAKLSLDLVILQPFRDLEGWEDETIFKQKMQEFEDTLKLMKTLGTDLLLVCSNCSEDASGDIDLMVDQLKKAAELAIQYNIRIAYENLSWSTHIKTISQLVSIVEQVNRPNFGLCLDSFHINIHNSKLIPYHKIFFVQFCDAIDLDLKFDISHYARNYRNFPGQGDYSNLSEEFDILVKSGYQGYISLEVFNRSFREFNGDSQYISDDGLRSLINLQLENSSGNLDVKIEGVQTTATCPSVDESEILHLSNFKNLTLITTNYLNLTSRLKELKFDKFFATNHVIIKQNSTQNEKLFNRVVLKVKNRVEYNRLALFCTTGLKMKRLKKDEMNVVNYFKLPLSDTFGYEPNENSLKITLQLQNAVF
ncbi:xylose isomerase-like protein [Scheffersomyces amazonensis]|uniref:xylose isomerase-like protein n=1 Tax=Scheffersomyces amazonensis TaxID=1078765 RepID=UPI00315D6BF2